MANHFSNMFGKSPIRPIQQHMAKVQETTTTLSGFFEAVYEGDWVKAEKAQKTIGKLENEADDQKKEVRLHLPKSLFLPVPRTDLLELLAMQDKIANRAKDIAGIMLGRKMEIPPPLINLVHPYLEECIAASAQALKAINELDELLEVGFRGKGVEVVEGLIRELDAIEHKTDVLEIEIRAKLFTLEAELPPVNVMFLYKVIDWIGDLADRSQKVGSRLLLLIAR